jgi:hypothetical protein
MAGNARGRASHRRCGMGGSVQLLPQELPRSSQVRVAPAMDSAPHGVSGFRVAGDFCCADRDRPPPATPKMRCPSTTLSQNLYYAQNPRAATHHWRFGGEQTAQTCAKVLATVDLRLARHPEELITPVGRLVMTNLTPYSLGFTSD